MSTDLLATVDSAGAKWNALAKCYYNTEKVLVANGRISTFHTKFSKDFSFEVVKNHKCLAKQMVKLVLPKRRIFCLIFNYLCNIKDDNLTYCNYFQVNYKLIKTDDQCHIIVYFYTPLLIVNYFQFYENTVCVEICFNRPTSFSFAQSKSHDFRNT